MCGIAGIITETSEGCSPRYQLDQMVKVQAHRGPWTCPDFVDG